MYITWKNTYAHRIIMILIISLLLMINILNGPTYGTYLHTNSSTLQNLGQRLRWHFCTGNSVTALALGANKFKEPVRFLVKRK